MFNSEMDDGEFYGRSYENRRGSEGLRNNLQQTDPPESLYRAKLREGFVDLRNSYHQKIQQKREYTPPASQIPPRPPMQVVPPYSQNQNRPPAARSLNERPLSHHGPAQVYPGESVEGGTPRRAVSTYVNQPLYRSNSDLHINDALQDHTPVHRGDYGSSEIIDRHPSRGYVNDEFFTMLQSYQSNSDQRAPPPSGQLLQQVFRGAPQNSHGSNSLERTNSNQPPPPYNNHHMQPPPVPPHGPTGTSPGGGTVIENRYHEDPMYSSPAQSNSLEYNKRSPKPSKKQTRPRSGDVSVLLRRLKPTKQDSADADLGYRAAADSNSDIHISGLLSEILPEERIRRKSFIHYDVQSIGINFTEAVLKRQNCAQTGNMKTGASAASHLEVLDTESQNAQLDSQGTQLSHLVRFCPGFVMEVGGEEEKCVALTRLTAQRKVQQLLGAELNNLNSKTRSPLCNGASILDSSSGTYSQTRQNLIDKHRVYVLEYTEKGCTYYRNFFRNTEHQNYFGIDENLGPVAISIKREKIKQDSSNSDKNFFHQYRVIVRTSELNVMRGLIVEDAIPGASKLSSSSRGLAAKDIIEYVAPDIAISSLKQATNDEKTKDSLMNLDEHRREDNHKIGVMYCKSAQSTEEEMYNNESGSQAFTDFLELIARRVNLKDFEGYRGGLDNKTDTTGVHSYHMKSQQAEIMFHISTLLPYSNNNVQQLLRKRHIGNDIVTIIFQEPGSHPFNVMSVRSQFQHVFIIVRVENPGTPQTTYRVAVTRAKDVPPFGPPLPDHATFHHGGEFADYLIAKIINAEHATAKSAKFEAMAVRTRQLIIKELCENSVTSNSLDGSNKLASKFSLGGSKKKDKRIVKSVPDKHIPGAIVWLVQLEDFSQSTLIDAYLAISKEMLVLIDIQTMEVVFSTWCLSVIGWTKGQSADSYSGGLRIYYKQGDCIVIRSIDSDDMTEITDRLESVTPGCQTSEMVLRRNHMGQLGFHVHQEGLVSDIEPSGHAWDAGLRTGSRLVEICKVATATLTHDQMIDLLRTSVTVRVIVIPPLEEGKPRRSLEDKPDCYQIYNDQCRQHRESSSENYSDITNVSPQGTVISSAKKVFTGTIRSNHSSSTGSSTSPGSTLSSRNTRRTGNHDDHIHQRTKSHDHNNRDYTNVPATSQDNRVEDIYGRINKPPPDERKPPNQPNGAANTTRDWYRPSSPTNDLNKKGTTPFTPRQKHLKRYRSQEVLARKHTVPVYAAPNNSTPAGPGDRYQGSPMDSAFAPSAIKRTVSDESLHSTRHERNEPTNYPLHRRASQEIALVRPNNYTGEQPGRPDEEDLDWNRLVSTATKAIEDIPTAVRSFNSSTDKEHSSGVSGTSTPTPIEKSADLENRCRRLEADLLNEKRKYQDLERRYRSDVSRCEEKIKDLERRLKLEIKRADDATNRQHATQKDNVQLRSELEETRHQLSVLTHSFLGSYNGPESAA